MKISMCLRCKGEGVYLASLADSPWAHWMPDGGRDLHPIRCQLCKGAGWLQYDRSNGTTRPHHKNEVYLDRVFPPEKTIPVIVK